MPPKARGKAKASSNSPISTTHSRNSGQPPDPFNQAPAKLKPLLEILDTNHVYITSVDKQPRDLKIKIFSVPLAMNIVIVILLGWRVWAIFPYYLKIFASVLGYTNETAMDVKTMAWNEISYEVGKRTLNGLFDLALWSLIWPWPRDFFVAYEQGTPVLWRTSIGFRDTEITIRKSRRWDQKLGDIVTENLAKKEGGQIFLTNVNQATSRTFMYERTGYLMMNNEWELDWTVMIIATKLVDDGELAFNDLKTSVLVHSDVYGWVTYEAPETSESKQEEEGQKKIVAFKDKLTAMGKESLFFRWIELMQYESTRPGGFTHERQVEAAAKVKELFERNGVDFEKFWAEIGGMENMPGVEIS